jgi:putative Mn2+ efflux pump MntP
MSLLLLALALSMDAFAAALAQGACARPRAGFGSALRIGAAFGLAQGVMPLLGWALGTAFASSIRDVDHWVAFALLAFIGGRMVREGLKHHDDATAAARAPARGWALLTIAIATSVDAAAAGVTLPLMEAPVLVACTVIGVVTLVLSAAGVLLGRLASSAVGQRAEVLGGLVLIGLGTRILVEHQFFGG